MLFSRNLSPDSPNAGDPEGLRIFSHHPSAITIMFRTQLFRAALRTQKATSVRQASTKSAQESAQQALSVAQKQAEKAFEASKEIGGRVGEHVGGWLGGE